jgi:hypothetical protein
MRWTGEERSKIYEDLRTIDVSLEAAKLSLFEFREVAGFDRSEINLLALLIAEARAACLSYLVNVVESAESEEAAAIQNRRHKLERRRSRARPLLQQQQE